MSDVQHIFIKEGVITFVGSLVEKVLRYLFVVIATYLMSPSRFGEFVLVMSVLSICYAVTNTSIHHTISYYVPQFLVDDKESQAVGVVQKATLVMISIGISISITIIIFPEFISNLLNQPGLESLLVILAPIIPLYALRDIQNEVFRSTEKVRYIVIMNNIIYPLFRLAVLGLLLVFAPPIIAFAVGELGGWVIAIGVGIYLLNRLDFQVFTPKAKSTVSLYSLWDYSLPLVGAFGIGIIITHVDFVLLGFFGSSEAPGLFRISISVAALSKMTSQMFKQISKPLYVRTENESPDLLGDFYTTTARWNAFLIVPVAVYIASIPDIIITLLFDPRYTGAARVVPVLVISYMLGVFIGNISTLLESQGRTRVRFIQNASIFLVNAGLDILLIPQYGILGAAIGTAFGVIVGKIVALYIVIKDVEIFPLTRYHGYYLLIGLGCFIITRQGIRPISGDYSIVIAPIVIGIIYLSSVFVLGGFEETDINVIEQGFNQMEDIIGYSPWFLLKAMKYRMRSQ